MVNLVVQHEPDELREWDLAWLLGADEEMDAALEVRIFRIAEIRDDVLVASLEGVDDLVPCRR